MFFHLFHNRRSSDIWSIDRRRRRKLLAFRSFLTRCQRTYRSFCLTLTWFLRLFIVLNRFYRRLSNFFEKIRRIFRLIHGWLIMIRSIFSAIHLFVARLMNLLFKIYQIFYLLSILFEPFSNRTFEKAVRSFSHGLYKYYSSNGACYTLKARTRHIIKQVRARWKRTLPKTLFIDEDADEVFYDALNEEYQ